ncbi:unnamed protein product [Closterium sp. Naga37s-1]|nr:unnamed protein product [Closterium sp. Naga37s-1]
MELFVSLHPSPLHDHKAARAAGADGRAARRACHGLPLTTLYRSLALTFQVPHPPSPSHSTSSLYASQRCLQDLKRAWDATWRARDAQVAALLPLIGCSPHAAGPSHTSLSLPPPPLSPPCPSCRTCHAVMQPHGSVHHSTSCSHMAACTTAQHVLLVAQHISLSPPRNHTCIASRTPPLTSPHPPVPRPTCLHASTRRRAAQATCWVVISLSPLHNRTCIASSPPPPRPRLSAIMPPHGGVQHSSPGLLGPLPLSCMHPHRLPFNALSPSPPPPSLPAGHHMVGFCGVIPSSLHDPPSLNPPSFLHASRSLYPLELLVRPPPLPHLSPSSTPPTLFLTPTLFSVSSPSLLPLFSFSSPSHLQLQLGKDLPLTRVLSVASPTASCSSQQLGKGSFGTVFRGQVDRRLGEVLRGSRREVAVGNSTIKVRVTPPASSRSFSPTHGASTVSQAEILVFGDLSHPNLERLLGYCIEGNTVALLSLASPPFPFSHCASLVSPSPHCAPFTPQAVILVFGDLSHRNLVQLLDSGLWLIGKQLACMVLGCMVLGCMVLGCMVLGCMVLGCMVLGCMVLGCMVLGCMVLGCMVLGCMVPGGMVLGGMVLGGMVLGGMVLGGMVLGGMVLGGMVLGGMVLGGMVLGGMVLGGIVLGGMVLGGMVLGGMVLGGMVLGGMVLGGMVPSRQSALIGQMTLSSFSLHSVSLPYPSPPLPFPFPLLPLSLLFPYPCPPLSLPSPCPLPSLSISLPSFFPPVSFPPLPHSFPSPSLPLPSASPSLPFRPPSPSPEPLHRLTHATLLSDLHSTPHPLLPFCPPPLVPPALPPSPFSYQLINSINLHMPQSIGG